MPFGPYKTFKECVEKNQDKKNPEGWCAELERRIKEQKKKGHVNDKLDASP